MDQGRPAQVKQRHQVDDKEYGKDPENDVEDGDAVNPADVSPLQEGHKWIKEICQNKREEKAGKGVADCITGGNKRDNDQQRREETDFRRLM